MLWFWFRVGHNSGSEHYQALFRTSWFVESLLTELVVALVVRTSRPCFRSKPGRLLWISTLLVGLLTFAIPYLPGGKLLDFTPLPLPLIAALITITLLYVLSTEVAKKLFYAHEAL